MGLLDRVTVEAPQQPARVYLYAAEKWGKTSFAAQAPKPIFLMTSGETGLLDLINFGQVGPTPHFPEDMRTWPDVMDAVAALAAEPHEYQTLVIDTANGAERLLADHVLHQEFNGFMTGKSGYGSYGKGDQACIPHWSEFLRRLDRVRTQRRMSIVLLAHSKIKSVNNPEGEDYDQFRPEGIDKLWPLTHKWASVIAAGTFTVQVKDDKASGGRERVIRLRGSAAVVGGNRYGLPESIPCGPSPASAWGAFARAVGDARAAAAKKKAAQPGVPAPAASGVPASPPPQAQPRPEPDEGFDDEPDGEEPRDMPAAERRTTPPKPAPVPVRAPEPPADDSPLKAGGALVQVLMGLLHQLELSWTQVRDRDPDSKGREIADAVGLAAGHGCTRMTDLTAAAGMKLKAELERRVAERRERAAVRAGNKARRETEAAGAAP